MSDPAHDFVENLALWFEQRGLPRMAGRLLGWLLVCDPPHQSADELAAGLKASRGSISGATRLMVAAQLVERVTFAGDRRTYYRARPDWNSLLESQFRHVIELRKLTEQGLAALADEPTQRRARLEGVQEFASFWERQLAVMLEERRDKEDPWQTQSRPAG